MADTLKDIRAGKIAGVYYLCGEAYPRDRMVAELRGAVVGDQASAFNYDAFDGKEAKAGQILAAARTAPMLGGRRLVQVRGAEALVADELNQMLDYLKDPAPYTCLLFIASAIGQITVIIYPIFCFIHFYPFRNKLAFKDRPGIEPGTSPPSNA